MTSRSQTSPNTELLDPLRIQSARMRRGLSQAELARRLGLTDRTVHRYETIGAPTRMGPKLSETLGFPDRFSSAVHASNSMRKPSVFVRGEQQRSGSARPLYRRAASALR
ncbi:helix-turn-helix domain-containing protein [Peptidiphaga gingivicola]|uniref:helix-turn-helix domain-containing protein n=1 Tax=Peptidiphaga gingivicola TaxID=2741497 RepID=UPI0038B2DE69